MMTSNTNIVMPQRSSANDSHFMSGSATTAYTAINPNFTEYRKRMLREQRFYNRAVKRLRKFLIEGFTLRDA